MRNIRGTRHSLPTTRRLTIIAQDPAIRIGGKILRTEVEVPAEELSPGPCGYRVNVIDFDASSNTLYEQAVFRDLPDGRYEDPFNPAPGRKKRAKPPADQALLTDPKFHAQNVYAIVMRTLARFELALGRRCNWG